MDPVTLLLLLGVPLFLFGKSKGKGRNYARMPMLETAAKIEVRYNIKGLTKFLDAIAYQESKHYANMEGDSGRSIGLFQMRTGTAFRVSNKLTKVSNKKSKLKDPVKATILAVDYVVYNINKLEDRGLPGQTLAVRRAWALPHLLYDFDETEERSLLVHDRYENSLYELGYPVEFMYHELDVSGYPGIEQVQKDLKVKI